MDTTTTLEPGNRHAYPMVRGGGVFLATIGIALIAGVVASGEQLVNYAVFFAGIGLATFLLILVARRFSYGNPTRLQKNAMIGAVTLEVLLFVAQGRLLPHGTPEATRWMWVLMIVGAHFLPMVLCFGPRVLALGLFCLANAAVGLWLNDMPVLFLLIDGSAKLAVGIWLLLDKPAKVTTPPLPSTRTS
ncbi:MAG TPA: DUF6609 family protein [Candidatus Acidoferrum sp.]|nr:DUF6609 family protein [Candidatus Acidoferrum sp.]